LNTWTVNDKSSIDDIRKKYPFLGNEIVKEVKARINTDDADEMVKVLSKVVNEIKESKPCVFINEPEQEVHIGFETFKSFPFTEKKIFDSTPEAVNFLLSKKQYLTHKYSKLKLIKNHLEREMKKVSNKINNLQAVIERGSKEKDYNKYGNLLLANLGLIKSRMTSIVLEDILEKGKKLKIDLNPKLSPQKNAEYYFDKSRSEKTSFAKNIQLLEKAKKDFDKFQQIQNSLNNFESLKDLDALMKKLKIKGPEVSAAKEDLSSKFKQYIIDDKYKGPGGTPSASRPPSAPCRAWSLVLLRVPQGHLVGLQVVQGGGQDLDEPCLQHSLGLVEALGLEGPDDLLPGAFLQDRLSLLRAHAGQARDAVGAVARQGHLKVLPASLGVGDLPHTQFRLPRLEQAAGDGLQILVIGDHDLGGGDGPGGRQDPEGVVGLERRVLDGLPTALGPGPQRPEDHRLSTLLP
jgi:hypothetical protein